MFKIIITKIIVLCLFLTCSVSMADDRFTDNGDGTVTDHLLKLMWSKSDNQGDIDWHQANKWIKYTFPDTLQTPYNNWRLPTLEELRSLYVKDENFKGYETECGQTVKIVSPIELTCGWLWTSEEKSITARVFNFNRGYQYTDRMVHKRGYRVLPVRNLK